MGRLEKIVVLTVLFLVAVVLGVALNSDSPNSVPESKGVDAPVPGPLEIPGGKIPGVLNRDVPHGNDDVVLPEDKTGGVLPTPGPVAPPAPAPTPEPKVLPAPAAYIVTLEGLAPSQAPELMFYTWQAGDSLASVAQRYYGSKDKLTRLQKANEGMNDASLKAGDKIWVPIGQSAPANGALADAGSAKIHVVQAGEVLSGISKKYYGSAKKWQKILDANQDILSSPERLKPGMKLRIPE